DELNGLLATVEQALAMDPGYPASRELYHEIMLRLQQIEIAADLDAIQIYMQNGNWSRAINLLDELRDKAYGETAVLINLLFDMAMILHDSDMRQAPVAVRESVAFLFDGQPADS